jgi:hypothetical protein
MSITNTILNFKTVRIGLFIIGYIMAVYVLYYSVRWEEFGFEITFLGLNITAIVIITIILMITLLSHTLIKTALLGKFGIDL